MNAKHSAGPWEVVQHDEIAWPVIVSSNATIAKVDASLGQGDGIVNRGVAMANANMLAASPEMFDALLNCEYLLSLALDNPREFAIHAGEAHGTIADAQAAISKARGKR